jgi:hypothetical protein
MRRLAAVLLLSATAAALPNANAHAEQSSQANASWDLVVYGGTAGGVFTAVAAAREGLKVALFEPGRHLGGMVSGGLGWTDYGKKEVIGGYALEFFRRVGAKYGEPITWHFEPHVAEAVFGDLVTQAGVQVFLKHRLREKRGVVRRGTAIESIAFENGKSVRGRIFADASYEGDLMAQAGVAYTWGREGSSEFGESLAGVRERTPKHQFTVRVNPYDDRGRLLPEVSAGPRGEPASADRKVQAYNFRVCMTERATDRVPFPKPRGYDARRFELLARLLAELDKGKQAARKPWTLEDVMKPDPLPNGKTDTNNNGAFSTDYIGGSYDYPEGSYAARARIWQAHVDYVQGFLYFLANDAGVPHGLHEAIAYWGLCQDEFVDNANWPYQLYVREARRMRGEYVMSQKDIQSELGKPDSIGMGSYNSDSHNVQRIATADGAVENEGDMQVPVEPYQIPYRMILPKRSEATNLLVPVAFGATHVAYSTLRMEPQYMIIGQAAGVAAKLALESGKALQDVDPSALAAILRKQQAVLELTRGVAR